MKTHEFGHLKAIAAATVLMAASIPAEAGFYDGKNINMIINVGAGGGLTRAGRTFATVMQKHLGADTNLVIKNLPGGGGVRGLNFMAEKAKPDGLTIMWGTSNPMAKLLGLPGVRYEIADFNVIGVGSSIYVSTGSLSIPITISGYYDVPAGNVPAIGTWGLVALTLLIVSVGSVLIKRRTL